MDEDFIEVKSYLRAVRETLHTFRRNRLAFRIVNRFLLKLDDNLVYRESLPSVPSTPVEALALKKDASTEVDLALFPSLPSSSPSQAPFPGSAEEGNSSFSFFKFFSILSLVGGSAYLIYLVGSCFLVPVPPIEDIIAAVNFFSSPVIPQVTPVVPEVIIPEPSSTIADYLPSYTTVIITTAVVVTL